MKDIGRRKGYNLILARIRNKILKGLFPHTHIGMTYLLLSPVNSSSPRLEKFKLQGVHGQEFQKVV